MKNVRKKKIVWTVDFCSKDPDFWVKKNDSFQESLIYLTKFFDVHIVALHINSNKDCMINGVNYHFCLNMNEMIGKVVRIRPDIINMWGFERPINKMIISHRRLVNVAKTVYIVGEDTINCRGDFPYCSRVFVSTEGQKRILERETLYPNKQIVVASWTATNIYNFKDYTKQDRYDVIYVSDWKRMKRQHLLLEALNLREFKYDRICFLGDIRDVRYFNEHKNKIENNSEGGYIEIIHRVPGYAVSNYYHESKIAVQLSSSEGGSRVVAEVLSSGVPLIVCNDCQSNVDQVKDGVNGFVVEPTPMAISKKIKLLLSNKDLRKKVGLRALEMAKKTMSSYSMRVVFEREFKKIVFE